MNAYLCSYIYVYINKAIWINRQTNMNINMNRYICIYSTYIYVHMYVCIYVLVHQISTAATARGSTSLASRRSRGPRPRNKAHYGLLGPIPPLGSVGVEENGMLKRTAIQTGLCLRFHVAFLDCNQGLKACPQQRCADGSAMVAITRGLTADKHKDPTKTHCFGNVSYCMVYGM